MIFEVGEKEKNETYDKYLIKGLCWDSQHDSVTDSFERETFCSIVIIVGNLVKLMRKCW